MKVLFDKDYSELKAIVYKKEDIEIVKDIVASYPVAWSTVREMILSGLEVNKIKFLCSEWNSRGCIISDAWSVFRSCVIKSEFDAEIRLIESQ